MQIMYRISVLLLALPAKHRMQQPKIAERAVHSATARFRMQIMCRTNVLLLALREKHQMQQPKIAQHALA